MTSRDGGAVAFAFPGVGVRPCGREAGFYAVHRHLMEPLLDAAGEAAGEDLARILREGGTASLADREQQFFTYAFGAAASLAFREGGLAPSCTAGYSFGIYAALFAAGALSFEDGIAAFSRAYDLMERASAGRGCSMGIVVGLEESDLRRLLDGAGRSLRLVNSNNDTCHVLSGDAGELDRALAAATAQDAFSAQRLPVGIPYHHPDVLSGASAEFAGFLDTLDWRTPACPVISSVDRRMLREAADLEAFAAANLSTPISWREVVRALDRRGFSTLVECGPGVSLTQNARFSATGMRWINLKSRGQKGGTDG
jgi:[acyl-carrier-protein] S-malonyltransferase